MEKATQEETKAMETTTQGPDAPPMPPTGASDKWSTEESRQLRAIAQRLLSDHYQGCRYSDPDNCGGCALTSGGKDGPNYAGWARVYVQAGRSIPAKWVDAFSLERASDNRLYAAALEKDIRTFGVGLSLEGRAFT